MSGLTALVPWGEPAVADPFAALAAVARLGAATALIAGPDAQAAVAQAARHGAARILLQELPASSTEHVLAAFAAAIAGQQGVFVLPADAVGEELAARLAIRCDGAALGRCTALTCSPAGVTAWRATHGGRAEVELHTAAARVFAALRRPAEAPQPVAAPEVVRLDHDVAIAAAPVIQALPSAGDTRRLQGARIVVAGGRGMAGPEGFALLQQLAHLLDAACGASLPAVDAGWAGVAQQVGQSGAFVTPALYLAVGMSGTAQHLAGIGTATRIIAINSDAEAEIFRAAEVGVVAPWQDLLPALIEALRGD